jgi:hypothetical protein
VKNVFAYLTTKENIVSTTLDHATVNVIIRETLSTTCHSPMAQTTVKDQLLQIVTDVFSMPDVIRLENVSVMIIILDQTVVSTVAHVRLYAQFVEC